MGSKQITKTRRNYTREINLKLLQIMNPPNKLERTHLLAKNEKQEQSRRWLSSQEHRILYADGSGTVPSTHMVGQRTCL